MGLGRAGQGRAAQGTMQVLRAAGGRVGGWGPGERSGGQTAAPGVFVLMQECRLPTSILTGHLIFKRWPYISKPPENIAWPSKTAMSHSGPVDYIVTSASVVIIFQSSWLLIQY